MLNREPTDLPDEAPSDAELWRALKAGSESAFESLFRRYSDALCDFAFSYVDDRDAAEDIVHSLFVALWHSRVELASPRSVRAYLLTAIRNRAVSHTRSDRVRSLSIERLAEARDPVSPWAVEPGHILSGDERAELLRAAIAGLPRRCREVVMLVRFNHLTHAEAAVVLGIAAKTVEIHLSRAIKLLRDRLRARG